MAMTTTQAPTGRTGRRGHWRSTERQRSQGCSALSSPRSSLSGRRTGPPLGAGGRDRGVRRAGQLWRHPRRSWRSVLRRHSAEPWRPVHQPAHHRRAWRARHLVRVLNRHDPHHADDAAAARTDASPRKALVFAVAVAFVTGLITCFGFVLPGPGDHVLASHQHDAKSAARAARCHRRRAVPDRLRVAGVRLRPADPAYRGRHHHGRRIAVRGDDPGQLPAVYLAEPPRQVDARASGHPQIWTTVPSQGQPAMFSPWTGFAVFCGYAAIALVGPG